MPEPAYLQEFADRAASVLGDDIDTSIMLQHHGVVVRAASSGDAAAHCDQAEAVASDGPCVLALAELRTVEVPDLFSETRWRAWCDIAVKEGFAAVLAVAAAVDEHTAISVNLYARRQEPWDERLLHAADGYARLAAGMVRLRLGLAELEEATAGVYALLDDEHVVGQAVVAIMRCNGSSEAEARRIVTSASSSRNVHERHVAETILHALTGTEPTAVG